MQYLHGQHKHWESISDIEDMQSQRPSQHEPMQRQRPSQHEHMQPQSDLQHFLHFIRNSGLMHKQKQTQTNINPKKKKITPIEILSGLVR